MVLLDQVKKMQAQGIEDKEIAKRLRERIIKSMIRTNRLDMQGNIKIMR